MRNEIEEKKNRMDDGNSPDKCIALRDFAD